MTNIRLNAMLRKIVREISPERTEEPYLFLKELNRYLSDMKANAIIGGSFGKNTHLKDDFDVDVFVQFNYNKYKDVNISEILRIVLEKHYEIEAIKGSRTYFHIKEGKILYEIVPVLKITDPKKAENTMDMSPLHVNWVRRNLIEKPELGDEIRLAKQFCKAQKVYGAESYIQGISGHVLDILIIHYGSFMKMVNKVSKWDDKTIIDVDKHYKDSEEILRTMNRSKMISPLIVIDPILPERNAAAALSKENYEKLKMACKRFEETPNEDFFKIKPIDKREKKNRVIIRIKTLNKREDIAGSKFVKAFNYLLKSAKRYGFDVKGEWEWDKISKGVIVLEADDISKEFIKRGPPLRKREDCMRFKERNRNWFEKDGLLYAKITREHTNIRDYIGSIINNIEDYVEEWDL